MHSQTDHGISTRYSLLSRLQNFQDNDSWRDFLGKYRNLIYSTAIRSGLTETEAQEVVQETLICVAKNIHKFERNKELGSFRGWLRNLTRWRIADQLRKRTRRHSGDSTARRAGVELVATTDVEPGVDWDKEWEEHLLAGAIERVKHKVKEEYFQAFDLYAMRQWPVHKVAETWG